MANNVYKGKTLTTKELFNQFYEQQEQWHNEPDAYRGLSFNHPELDKLTGGARIGDLIGLAGAHKAGKSLTNIAMILNFAFQIIAREQNEAILLVSLEMQHRKLAGRALSNLATIDYDKFRDLGLSKTDFKILRAVINEYEDLPIFWNTGCDTIEGIHANIEEIEAAGLKVRLIAVDYFQLMNGTGEKEWEVLAKISKASKAIAMKKDCTVILLTQQTTETLNDLKKAKQRGSVAGGRNLERDLDLFLVILPIFEDKVEIPYLREVWIALARDGEMGVGVEAFFSGKYARFGQIDRSDIPEYIPSAEQEAIWTDW